MKKIILFFLSIIFIEVSLNAVEAKENKYYYYGVNDNAVIEYVKEYAGDYIYDPNISYDFSEITVGYGFVMLRIDEMNSYIFPVYYKNKLLMTIEVFDIDGQIGGCCSTKYVDLIEKCLAYKSSAEEPMLLCSKGNNTYIIIGGDIIDINKDNDENIQIDDIELYNKYKVYTSNDKLEINLTKSGTGYYDWYTYYMDSNNICCGPKTLFNIYRNVGNYWTYNSMYDDITAALNVVSLAYMNRNQIKSYLDIRGYLYNSYTEVGYLNLYQIISMTQTNGKYGIAFSESGSGDAHVTAIIGYSSSSIGDYVYMFDPNGNSSSSGIIKVSLNTRTFSSNGITYCWNSGYIKNVFQG